MMSADGVYIESARCAHPRCYGVYVGIKKGYYTTAHVHVCDTYEAAGG
jgi:hypothetical protein